MRKTAYTDGIAITVLVLLVFLPTLLFSQTKLTGTVIGTSGSYQNAGNTIAKAIDGDISTFYDAASGDGNWVGFDLGAAFNITKIRFYPRSGFAYRMIGGMFQGSTTPDFTSNVTTLYTINAATDNAWSPDIFISLGSSFRYVRYLAPNASWGNIAELEVYGNLAPCFGTYASGGGYYTALNGKVPVANGKYFVNHVFSTFSTTASGSLNGINITGTRTGTTGTYNLASNNPNSGVVAGTNYPSTAPFGINISPTQSITSLLHAFDSSLKYGTHVWIQDCDGAEAWNITFKDSSNTVIDPSAFDIINISTTTTSLPAIARTSSAISVRGVAGQVSEPLVGIIINSTLVRSITYSIIDSLKTTTTKFFYSVPITPTFSATAASNGTICSGSAINLTATPGTLGALVPTPLTYTWSGPSSYSSTTQNPTISNASTGAGGTYSVDVKDAFGCTTVTATTAAVVNPSPVVSLSSNTPVTYANSINLTANVSSGTTPYTLSWSGPNSFSTTTQNPSISSASSAKAGVYAFTATDSKGCITKASTYVAVSSGWIYVHDKSINEESSVNFSYTLKDNSGNLLNNFVLNDSAGNALNMYDIGAGHEGGVGELWAVAGTTSGTNNTGTVYKRPMGSSQWFPTNVTNATAVDGAGSNQFVYINSSGDGYFYNAGTSTLIFNHLTSHNGQTANGNDIAYGGGKIALRNSNGRVYIYTGDLTNDNWTDISNNTNIAERIDLSTDGSKLVYIKGTATYSYNIASGVTTTLPVFTTVSDATQAGTRDIAIDDNGTVYATGNTGTVTGYGKIDVVYTLASNASTWVSEPEARGVVRLTAGPGGQAWGGVNLGAFNQSIYTRVTDELGTHLWIDDTRIKNSTSIYGNEFMVEVAPNQVYKLTEALPNSTVWDLGRYNIYDPTGNSTGNVTNQTATIRPAAGEVVHVEYINEKLNPKLIDNGNCNTSILQSFDAGSGLRQFGNDTYGTPLEGTSYHYYAGNGPQDGYYYLVKGIDGVWFHDPHTVDHTGNGGYFLMVNASYGKDEFYRQRITGLTENLTYRIEFYTANVSNTSPIKPKLRFGMQTLNGTIFGDSTTAEIPGDTVWHRYSVSFTVPAGTTTADLFLRNENIGGSGNDLAIDDIAINPIPTPLVDNVIHPANLNNLCVGSSYFITNTVGGGTWSISDTSVASVDTATGVLSIKGQGAADIVYTYINNIYCVSKATSNVTISVPPGVNVTAASTDVCKGGVTTLHATPINGKSPYKYAWTTTGGSLSSATAKSPQLTAPTSVGTYTYKVVVTDSLGCSSPATATAVNVRAPDPSVNLLCNLNAQPKPYARLLETGSSSAGWLWSSPTDSVLFYTSTSLSNGQTTSSLQSPYINRGGNYKVAVTDTYGCVDSAYLLFDYSSCILLPVTLKDFVAVKKGAEVLLSWRTTNEQNSKYFEVERSTDNAHWSYIGRVNANGTGNLLQEYALIDDKPAYGVNYYRLKQIDADGKFSYSYIRAVSMNPQLQLLVYPNPVRNSKLHYSNNVQLKTVRVIDVNGKVLSIKNNVDAGDNYINLHNISAGFYMLSGVDKFGNTYRAKFIKQ